MKQSLNLKLGQQLTLTPQLKQSLKLLQLSSLELEHEIQQELDSNPLLEQVETDSPYQNLDNFEDNAKSDWQEAFEPQRTNGSSNSSLSNEAPEMSQYVSTQESLHEHLRWQIQMSSLTKRDQMIANSIIASLNEDGYLKCDADELHQFFADNLNENESLINNMVEVDEINAMLSFVKTLDPIGAGARNLPERLLIFLDLLDQDTPNIMLAKRIITDHIELLANRNYSQLQRALETDNSNLKSAVQLITQLNPRIGNRFKADEQSHIIPDLIVKKTNNGWRAELNPANQIKLRTNQTYADLLKAGNLDKNQSEYIQTNLQQAKTLVKGLMSRYDTLLLVGQEIVKQQSNFFESGELHLKPMGLQLIADHLELHESTISRATSGKYLSSPSGVYELKYFFSSALTSDTGEASSSTAIRSLIQKMVDNEPKQKPLSDNKIAMQLSEQGFSVARRTVAKYRESLQIAPSSQRKVLM